MKVGDLVRLCPQNRQTPIRNSRNNLHMYSNKVGIVLSLRLGTSGKRKWQDENADMIIRQKANDPNLIARVVWSGGENALMYITMLEVISESR